MKRLITVLVTLIPLTALTSALAEPSGGILLNPIPGSSTPTLTPGS